MIEDKSKFREISIYLVIIVIAFISSQHMNVVVSKSMEPVLYRGDIVLTQKTNFMGFNEFNVSDINVGDIVIYNATWFDDGPVIHRVIGSGTDKKGRKYFIIKGDNNPSPDPAVVYPSQILSRAIKIGDQVLIIPYLGQITLSLRGL